MVYFFCWTTFVQRLYSYIEGFAEMTWNPCYVNFIELLKDLE